MKGLRPPLVGRDAEALYAGDIVAELLELFVKCEERDQREGSSLDGERSVAKGVGIMIRWFAREFRMRECFDYWVRDDEADSERS